MQMLREFKIRSTKSRIPATTFLEETGIKKVLSCAKLNWNGRFSCLPPGEALRDFAKWGTRHLTKSRNIFFRSTDFSL
jgi:hypothetical protein